MPIEPAFSQRAAALMAAPGGPGQVPDAAAVLAEIARQGPNPGAALAGRPRVPGAIGVGHALPAPLAALARLAAGSRAAWPAVSNASSMPSRQRPP
jgi:hypothetical protein